MALIKERTKKRKGENVIGKIIYGFLLFMPLLAVLIACMYVVFNKNAYESYGDYEQSTYTEITTYTQLQENKTYYITYKPGNFLSGIYVFSDINIETPSGTNATRIYNDENGRQLFYYLNYDLENDTYTNLGNATYNKYKDTTIRLELIKFANYQGTYNLGAYVNTLIQQKGTLDNVFYYQIENLEESNLFNWTKTTGTYEVLHNTTTMLGISNTYTPMLLSYWLLISVMYFIYDIALILIWAVHDKIHELKDSI